jgi:hypothetical protein
MALSSATESEIKATFLFNLGRFITWPANAFSDSLSVFRICVLGQAPFKEELDIVVRDQRIAGHVVKIERLTQVEDTGNCHILFVSDSEQLRLLSIFKWIAQQPILTVSDIENFVRQGGMVEFYPRRGQIRLIMDPQMIKEVGLKPSARLLSISDLVNAPQKKKESHE